MKDAAEEFRNQLSMKLREAMKVRDQEAVSTIRTLITTIDNAGAISKDEAAKLAAANISEAPRKKLSNQDLKQILDSEFQIRVQSIKEYESLGNAAQVSELKKSLVTIESLSALLG